MIETPISDQEMEERLRQLTSPEPSPRPVDAEPKKKYKLIRPTIEHLKSWVEYVLDPRDFWKLGFAPMLDMKLRGFRPSEFVEVCGYSQSGKSQVVLNSVIHNLDKPFIWFGFDEAEEMVTAKLVAMLTDSSTEELEEGIKRHDKSVMRLMRQTVEEKLSNFVVVNERIGPAGMTDAIKEAEDMLQAPLAAVGIDYLAIIPQMRSDEIYGKFVELKDWSAGQEFPTFVVHQNTRSRGGPGEPVTMMSGKEGGEDIATLMLGARLQRFNEKLEQWQRDDHANTISVSVVKNKRGSWLGESDFYFEPKNGLILPRDADPAYVHDTPQTVGGGRKLPNYLNI